MKKLKIPYNQWKRGGLNKIPHIQDCIEYVESCGFKYSHRCILNTYVFYRIDDRVSYPREISFSLHEIREAYKYGF